MLEAPTEHLAAVCFHSSLRLLKDLGLTYRTHSKGVIEFQNENCFPFFLYLHSGDTECAIEDCSARIALGFSMMQSLFLIQLGMWGDPRFFDWVGKTDNLSLPINYESLPLPIGFDIEAQCIYLDEPMTPNTSFVVGTWANEYLQRLCDQRTACLRYTFETSIRGLIFHELGHLTHGHASKRLCHSTILKRFNPLPIPTKVSAFPSWGCEIVADRFALKNVLQLAIASSDQPALTSFDQMVCLVGSISTFFPQHISLDLQKSDSRREDPQHPPIWFRCYDLIREAAKSKGVDDNNLFVALGQIANLHPLFATLLHPIRDNEVYERHRTISEVHLTAMEEFSAIFDNTKKTFGNLA